jgi:hypothetical protein
MPKIWICDPPSGWQYGFPKQMPDDFRDPDADFDLTRWLIDEGYPEKDVALALRSSRYWEMEIE